MLRATANKHHGDGEALLGGLESEEAYDETSKRSSFQENKLSEDADRRSDHIFDTDDYITDRATYGRRSYFARLRKTLRDLTTLGKPSSAASAGTSNVESSKLSRTIRVIFNYPEPGLKLRGTAWLDGVRGLAAFEVFIYHYAREWVDRDPAWGPTKTEFLDPAWYRFPFIRTFYNAGHASVALFFAISGYVLSHKVLSLCAQHRHDEAYASLSSAIFRRAIRLFAPAAIWTFIVMLLCWTFDGWLPKPEPYTIAPTLWEEILYWAGKVVAMLLPVNYPERWTAIMNHFSGNVTWTISLEYYGSLVVYGALLFTSRTHSFIVRQALLMCMIVLSFMKDDWVSGQFLLGMGFADYQLHRERLQQAGLAPYRNPAQKLARKVFFYVVFAFGWFLSGLPLVHPAAGKDENDHPIASRPFFDIIAQPLAWTGAYDGGRQADQYLYALAGLCVLVGIGETGIKKLMEARWVQYLGKISFGFYLVHVPMRAWLGLLDPFWFSIVGSPYIPYDQRTENLQLLAVWLMRMGPAIVINLIVGGLFERFVDRPTIQFSRNFEMWCLAFGKQKPEQAIALPQYQSDNARDRPTDQGPFVERS